MKITQAELARICDVNRSTISRAVMAGNINVLPDGKLDTSDLSLMKYIARRGKNFGGLLEEKPQSKNPEGGQNRKEEAEIQRQARQESLTGMTKEELEIEKFKADIRDKRAATKAKELMLLQKAREVIPKNQAEYLYVSFIERAAKEFLRMPKKLSAQIANYVDSHQPEKILSLLDTEITIIIRETKKAQEDAVKTF